MKTLYLHIGSPKTATTSIQMFCEDNKEALLAQGYAYPLLDYIFPHIAQRRNGHFLVGGFRFKDGKPNKEKDAMAYTAGLDMLHETFKQVDNIILSDENLWNASRGKKFAFWNKIHEDSQNFGYQIKVIVYLRRQDDYINSWLSQQIKDGWNTFVEKKLSEFVKAPKALTLDYYSALNKISAVVGQENVCVRVFERDKFGGRNKDVYSDFLEAIGVEYTDEFVLGQEENNTSISGNYQEIKRVLNSVGHFKYLENEKVMGYIFECEKLKDPNEKFNMLSEEETNAFLSKYQEGNDAIAKEYLHMDGPMFHEGIKDLPVWNAENPYMAEAMIRFFGQVYVDQEKRISKLEEEVENLKKFKSAVSCGIKQKIKNKIKNKIK